MASDVEAYALIQLAVALSRQEGRQEEAIILLQRACSPRYRNTPTSSLALLRLGVFTYNHSQDVSRAMPFYQEVVNKYPDSSEAERAMYYCCWGYAKLKQPDEAERQCKIFITRYPNSQWVGYVRHMLEHQIPELNKKGTLP